MADFVKKGALGYSPVRGGVSDYECTHVILTKDEYEEMINTINYERAEISRLSDKYSKEATKRVVDAKENAENQIFRIKQEYKMKYEDLEGELRVARKDADFQRNLNLNLLRITRERANADRKISKKKDHSGYRVVNSEEFRYKYSVRQSYQSVMLWKTTLQTPYSVDFSEEQARELTKELFEKDEEGMWLIQAIGIDGNCNHPYEEMLQEPNWQDHDDYNVALDRRLKANYRDGYWEIIINHTKPLNVISKEMRYK